MGVEVEPSANPSDGEQQEQEDWRQLTGFLGIGEERQRNRNNETRRRTRLATELHHAAFENMWIQQGLLPENEILQGQPSRQQEEERDGDNDNSNHQQG